jgi:hypothetical protein
MRDVLRASHIKPWKKSSNDERLDPENGLLLLANIDILFEKGFVSFDDDGCMLVSKDLSGPTAACSDCRRTCGAGPTRASGATWRSTASRSTFRRRRRVSGR